MIARAGPIGAKAPQVALEVTRAVAAHRPVHRVMRFTEHLDPGGLGPRIVRVGIGDRHVYPSLAKVAPVQFFRKVRLEEDGSITVPEDGVANHSLLVAANLGRSEPKPLARNSSAASRSRYVSDGYTSMPLGRTVPRETAKSRSDANEGNRWQTQRPRNPLGYLRAVADGRHQLRPPLHGKEGVREQPTIEPTSYTTSRDLTAGAIRLVCIILEMRRRSRA
jgi:hypothetical protein